MHEAPIGGDGAGDDVVPGRCAPCVSEENYGGGQRVGLASVLPPDG